MNEDDQDILDLQELWRADMLEGSKAVYDGCKEDMQKSLSAFKTETVSELTPILVTKIKAIVGESSRTTRDALLAWIANRIDDRLAQYDAALKRVEELFATTKRLIESLPKNITVNVPKQPAPIVNVASPELSPVFELPQQARRVVKHIEYDQTTGMKPVKITEELVDDDKAP